MLMTIARCTVAALGAIAVLQLIEIQAHINAVRTA